MKVEDSYQIVMEYAPLLYFDNKEPFLPIKVGYTVCDKEIKSPSFTRKLTPSKGGYAIEYAIYWDWDIAHHYDLEHLWVFIDDNGEIESFEGTAHGLFIRLWPDPPLLEDLVYALNNKEKINRELVLKNDKFAENEKVDSDKKKKGQLIAYSQPGKHGFAPDPSWYKKNSTYVIKECTYNTDNDGLHQGVFSEKVVQSTEFEELINLYLQRNAFIPSLKFEREFKLNSEGLLIPWDKLYQFVPDRIKKWYKALKEGTEL